MSNPYLEIYHSSNKKLEEYMQKGTAPTLEELVGSEFDGLNTPWYTALLGIKKFRKGFYNGPPRSSGPEPFIQGYNMPVKQNGLEGEWIPKPSPEKPKHFGFFRVYLVNPKEGDNEYPNSLLLNYKLGGNPFYAAEKLLRDYLVKPLPDNSDIFLGKAYLALGVRIYVSYFVLRRAGEVTYQG